MIIQITTHDGKTKPVSVHKTKAELYTQIIEIARLRLENEPRAQKKSLCREIALRTSATERTVYRVLTDIYEL